MANALGTLFGDIAGAIREKTGDTAKMKPAEFPEKIAAIETEPVLQDKTVTENGTYTADEGFDGLGEVTVDVAGAGDSYAKIVERTISGDYVDDRVTSVGPYAFYNCTNLNSVNVPVATKIDTHSFYQCTYLTRVDLSAATIINAAAFGYCKKLETLILRNTQLTALTVQNSFNNTPIASGNGYIYVPATLVDSYKAATNWSAFATKFRAIEDYPDVCGG